MNCAETTMQGTALCRKFGLSVPVISLLATITRIVGAIAWVIERVRRA
jgi:disulfide bond formation protein DsbB